MKATIDGTNVRANCPDCDGALTTFERIHGGSALGHIVVNSSHYYGPRIYSRVLYLLLRCAGCGRGGLAKVHDDGSERDTALEWFFPNSIELAQLPDGVPMEISADFREAEVCASFGAQRGASALVRSALEKALKASGYIKRSLEANIDDAADDGVITSSRRQKAHEDVRVLGNDVLHDEWREVTDEEVTLALHYTQRVLEDLYDDRSSVESILIAKKRLTEKAK
jgi:hypothetical protein